MSVFCTIMVFYVWILEELIGEYGGEKVRETVDEKVRIDACEGGEEGTACTRKKQNRTITLLERERGKKTWLSL